MGKEKEGRNRERKRNKVGRIWESEEDRKE